MKDLMAAYRLVLVAFKGDRKKARLWFMLDNPFFGSIRPVDMFRVGRGAKALKIIRNLIEGNF